MRAFKDKTNGTSSKQTARMPSGRAPLGRLSPSLFTASTRKWLVSNCLSSIIFYTESVLQKVRRNMAPARTRLLVGLHVSELPMSRTSHSDTPHLKLALSADVFSSLSLSSGRSVPPYLHRYRSGRASHVAHILSQWSINNGRESAT